MIWLRPYIPSDTLYSIIIPVYALLTDNDTNLISVKGHRVIGRFEPSRRILRA